MKSARNAGLLAVCCVLVHDAFGDSSINSGGGGAQLALRYGDILGESFAKLLDSSFRTGLHHAVPQGLFLNDANAFLSGLDIRQLPSPPAITCAWLANDIIA